MSQPELAAQAKSEAYLTDAYYNDLLAWQDKAASFGVVTDPGIQVACSLFLHHEARLLDSRRFMEWLELLSHDCVYWLPAQPNSDPRQEVTISFDDRRRLEDRIVRLETGFAHNQEPDRRLCRFISNVEAWECDGGTSRRVMAKEHVYEHRTGRHMVDYVVSLDYWLVKEGEDWKIKVKKAQLINSLDGLELPTFL